MRTLILTLAAGLALAACSDPRAEAERELRVQAIERLAEATGDRPGLRILWLAVSPAAPQPTVCGEANLPTVFGGVTQARRFMMVDGRLTLMDATTPAATVYDWGRWCRVPAR